MTAYTKTTNFAAKDSLLVGNSNKIIKGSEHDVEYTNIATAVNSKANTSSPTFTGTATFENIGSVALAGATIENSIIGGVTPAAAAFTTFTLASGATVTAILDEDDFASNSATAIVTQQSAKAYADTKIATTSLLDEDNFASNSATAVPSQQSVKAYADTKIATSSLLDEDNFASNSATSVPSQQSVKAYADTKIATTSLLDEDDFASNSAIAVPSQQSTKAYVDAVVVATGPLLISGTPIANDYVRFTDGFTLEGRSYAEARSDLSLEIGTDVLAYVAPSTSGNLLTSNGSAWISSAPEEVTRGTLTKTFTTGEVATMTLSSAVTAGAPVVSVSKEIPQTGVSNGNWDVNSTTENYTRLDSAPATTLDWVGFDLTEAAYSQSFSVTSQESQPSGVQFNTDGTKMFVVGRGGDEVNEYALSAGFDVSTASYTQVFSVAAQDSQPEGIAFSPDGTKMFIVGPVSVAVNEYLLTTAYDISTASFTDAFSVATQESSPFGIAFNTDGTKMFVVGSSGQDVNEYALSTGFDVSTASFTDAFSVSSQETAPFGIAFNTQGTRMFVSGTGSRAVHEYLLTTGFDVSTASFVVSFSVLAQDTAPKGLAFNTNGTKMYVVGLSGDDINEYTIASTLALGTGSFVSADVGKTIEANSGVFVLTATSGAYVESTAPTSYAQVASGAWEMYGVVYNAADGDLELSGKQLNAFNISTAVFVDSFSVSAQETSPSGLAFNANGTKMFVVGYSGDDVNEYTLSTGFDVSTASFVDSFSVAAQQTTPLGLIFSTDGTKMFVVGGTSVYEYALTTGFDVSTASFTDALSVSGQDSSPIGIAFNTNGTKMFLAGNGSDAVYEYSLSTGFDISTASYTDSFSISGQEAAPQGLAFNIDGTKMFITGTAGDDVNSYALTTGFDVSTASFTSAFDISGQDTAPQDIAFNTDGTKMLILGLTGTDVNEYEIGSFVATSGYNAVHTTASIDSTYWTDINSMTADQAAGDGNVYYAISTDDRTTWGIVDNTSGERDIVRNNAGTWQYNSNGTYASETWVAGATNTELATIAEAMEGASVGFGISSGTYLQSFSVASQETGPQSLAFNGDGTKMFVVGMTGDDVNEYALTTGFDVSTASFTDAFSIAAQEIRPTGLAFNIDGTKMFVVGWDSDNVNEYALTTGFDVSTSSFTDAFSVSAQDTVPQGLAFSTDGTKMFIVGATGDDINEYALSTGFDVSTASFTDSFSISAQDTSPIGLAFSTDGTKMFVVGGAGVDINEYALTTGFDVSTASFTGIFSVSAQDTNPTAMTFNTDGTKMFVVGLAGQSVYEYSSVSSYTNKMDKTQLDAVTDANHIVLGNDLDLAIVFNLASGTTVPSSDGVAINYDANVLNELAVVGADYDADFPATDKVRITALSGANLKVRVV
jgi:sugar lactone lactonase YvrE